jgi:hypothetical protein
MMEMLLLPSEAKPMLFGEAGTWRHLVYIPLVANISVAPPLTSGVWQEKICDRPASDITIERDPSSTAAPHTPRRAIQRYFTTIRCFQPGLIGLGAEPVVCMIA